MITELLGLAGSGVAGAIFGTFSDWMQSKSDIKKLEIELEIKRRANEAGQTLTHVKEIIDKPAFAFSFGMLVFTYCSCAVICFTFPDVPILTFNPDEEPKTISIFWGLVAWERQLTQVYQVTTGGIGYSLLHPIAFQIGTVVTGINASPRR